MNWWFAFLIVLSLATGSVNAQDAHSLRIATFQVDATPPLGSPLCDALVEPARQIVDPLSARGIVLLTDQKPIVLCVVDWVGIGNGGHDRWRNQLAHAAGTTPDRVAVHTVHQHDAPGCDFDAEAILQQYGLGGRMFDPDFARTVIERVADAVRVAAAAPQSVTHLGLGVAEVEQVASNRRILGSDGKVKIVRYSSSQIPEAIAAPEGLIDPKIRSVSFWNGDKALAVMTHYATHPQSYYGKGGVSADFVGLARTLSERDLPGVVHLHFNGAGGNVAVGKYNNGSPELRPILAARLAAGMKSAWQATEKTPLLAPDISWSYKPVALPPRDFLVEADLRERIQDETLEIGRRCQAARELAFLNRVRGGHKIHLTCLQLGPARLLYMPGELFVEYQLAAQELRPQQFVAMAAYGDYGPGYIGTRISYSQGGYETGRASKTAPEVEAVLLSAMGELLGPKPNR